MTGIQGSFAGMNTVRNISLIQRSLSKAMHRAPSIQDPNAEVQESPSEIDISSQMRSQIGSLTERIRTLEFKLGKNEAAAGAIQELVEKAKEMRKLALEAAEETAIRPDAGGVFQTQLDVLAGEYKDKLEQASYDGKKLLDGSRDSAVSLAPMSTMDVSVSDSAKEAVKEIDRSLRVLAQTMLDTDAKSRKEYEKTIRSFEVAAQNLTAADSLVQDTDSAIAQARYLSALFKADGNSAAASQSQMTSDTVFKLLHA